MKEEKKPVVKLVVKEKGKKRSIVIKDSWIERWSFLSGIISELEVTEIPWTYTSGNELDSWVSLNNRMDRAKKIYDPLLLSTFWSTVQFMTPVDENYLLYCKIDEALPLKTREELYLALGRHIRDKGERRPYTEIPKYFTRNRPYADRVDGLYQNFQLFLDPAYSIQGEELWDKTKMVPNRDLDDQLRDIIRDCYKLNVATGIMQTAYYSSMSTQREKTKEDRYLYEVPWDYVNWKDVITFVPNITTFLHHKGINKSIYEIHIGRYTNYIANLVFDFARDDMVRSVTKLLSSRSPHAGCIEEILAGASPETKERSTQTQLAVKVMKDDNTISILVPEPKLFIAKMLQYYKYTASFSMNRLLDPLEGSIRRIPIVTKLNAEEALSWVIYLTGMQAKIARAIDSSEFPVLCRTIASTLGEDVLETCVESVIRPTEREKPAWYQGLFDSLETEKKRLFCEAALTVLEEGDLPRGFSEWPTMKYVKEWNEV
jgi:hypothetical protein